jgi:hypothetical protein
MAVVRTADLMTPAPHYCSGTSEVLVWPKRNILTLVTIEERSIPRHDAV